MSKIAVLITSFKRDKLLYNTVQTVIDNWSSDFGALFVANQSYKTGEEKDEAVIRFGTNINNPNDRPIYYYNLDFDCGLSYARNFLVSKAFQHEFKYVIISADSIQFPQQYDLSNAIDFLETKEYNGIIGFDLKDRVSWERDLELVEGKHFSLKRPARKPMQFNGVVYQPVDICRNFFLAKTECLLNVRWDNDLKLGEHEDFFYRFKHYGPYNVFYNIDIRANYVSDKPEEYMKYRQRLYKEFIPKLKAKYDITGFVDYEH